MKLEVKHFTGKDVSIVIPVHNEEKTLDQCLMSVRSQKVSEIIVVLDKCKDSSPEIAETHAKNDFRVKIFTLPEHTFKINYMAETVNFGLSQAKNNVLGFVDADTILGKNYISLLLPYLKNSMMSVCGQWIPTSKRFLQFRETIGGTGRLFSRQLWEETGGFRDVQACDTFFDLEILKRGGEFKVINKAVMFDARKYSVRKLTEQSIRRGKGRRQIGQSFFFMMGHGLYCMTRTPFGVVELLANIIGYLTTRRMAWASRKDMKRYETRRIQEIVKKLRSHARNNSRITHAHCMYL